MSRLVAFSAARPAYMTITSSAMSATTPRSWVIMISAVPRLLLQPQQQVEDLRLDGRVERGGGLVGDDQLGLEGERHRDHRALPHAAGELVRVVVDPLSGLRDAHPAQQLDRPLVRLASCETDLSWARIISRDLPARPGTAGAGWSAGPGRSPRSRAPRTLRSSSRRGSSRSAPVEHRAARDLGARGQPEQRLGQHGLAAARLADDPSVRPGSTPNDTPRTARTTPSAVGKLTCRSFTSSRLTGSPPSGHRADRRDRQA